MPEPGMGANNDHSTSSTSSMGGGGDSGTHDSSSSSNDTTADTLSKSNTTADTLSSGSTNSNNNSPTTAESLANSRTTGDTLSSTPTHSYDEVPSIAVSLDPPTSRPTTAGETKSIDASAQLPDGVPNEYAELFGAKPNPIGGVDAVWANGDGTYSSSDGSTYDPSTGKGTYDAGEDSFAVTRTSVGLTLDGDLVSITERERHPDRVRTSESLALVQHDPQNMAKAYGNRAAFDYYNNPNMDSIRDSALMQAAARANEPVSGRYPGENMAYIGVMPLTAHLARSIRVLRTNGVAPVSVTRASVDDKLARYLLNKDHPIGGSKADWFDQALGYNQKNADDLARQINFNENLAVKTSLTEHGQKYNQTIAIQGANGKTIDVNFGWIRNNDGDVRLVTAIPTKQ